MGLKQKEAGENGYPILIEAYDGLGNIFKEEVGNNRFTIGFVKPATPKLKWDKYGELQVTNRNNYQIKAYRDYISDVKRERDKEAMDFNDSAPISRYTKLLGWEKGSSNADNGTPAALRIVAQDVRTQMYSDAKVTIYAPLKFGHYLEVKDDSISNVAHIPFSYIQGQYLVKQPKPLSQATKVQFNNKNGINGGVQLTRFKKAISEAQTVKFIYFPVGGKNKEDSNALDAFGGRYTMYLKIEDTDTQPIAAITYIDDYANNLFYIEYDGQLYMGRFTSNNNFNSDSTAYVLKGSDEFNIEELQNLSTIEVSREIQDSTLYRLENSGRHINFGTSLPVQKTYDGVTGKKNQETSQPDGGNSGSDGGDSSNNNGNGDNSGDGVPLPPIS